MTLTFELLQFIFNFGISIIISLLYMRIRSNEEQPNWRELANTEKIERLNKMIEKESMISIEMEKAINLLRDRLTALEEKDATK